MAMHESSPKRRRLSAPARRDQLLDVTTELVIEDGFQGVSIESVAQGANVARSLVYKHFADRAALLDAVVERETAHALTQVSETTLTDLSEGPPRELMLESLRAYLHVVRSHPMTWRLVLMPPQGAPEILGERVEAGRAAVLGRLIEAVRPALPGESETLTPSSPRASSRRSPTSTRASSLPIPSDSRPTACSTTPAGFSNRDGPTRSNYGGAKTMVVTDGAFKAGMDDTAAIAELHEIVDRQRAAFLADPFPSLERAPRAARRAGRDADRPPRRRSRRR